MENEVKVYCKDCKFLHESKNPPGGYQPKSYKCNHPTNLRLTDIWFEKKEREISTPKEINWNNACPYFKQKGK